MYHNCFIHSSVNGHLGCFHVLAIVNAVMNTGYTCLLELWFSQGIYSVVGLLGHMVVLFLVFKEISILFSIVAVSIYILTSSTRGFPCLYILSSICCLQIFDVGHSDWYEMIHHFRLGLHFPNDKWCWAIFHVLINHLSSLEKCLFRSSDRWVLNRWTTREVQGRDVLIAFEIIVDF